MHCAANILKKIHLKKRLQRYGRLLQTISQCRHSGRRRKRKREIKEEKKKRLKEGDVQKESETETVRKTDRNGRRTPNVKQHLKWKNSSLDSSSLADEDH